jgi:U-box domain
LHAASLSTSTLAITAHVCCLQDIMRNPVIAQDGHRYEKSAIDQWFRQHSTSPVTGAVVGDPRVQVPNRGMRAVAALYHRYMALALQTEHTLP